MSKLSETIRDTIISAINDIQAANNADIEEMRAIHVRIIERTDELRDLSNALAEVVNVVDETVEMNEDIVGTAPETDKVPTYEEAEALMYSCDEDDELFDDEDEEDDEDAEEDGEEDGEDDADTEDGEDA